MDGIDKSSFLSKVLGNFDLLEMIDYFIYERKACVGVLYN